MYGYMYVNMEVLFPFGEGFKPLRALIRTTRGGRRPVKPAEPTLHSGKTPPAALSRHLWRSKQGEKRTIPVPYEPSERLLKYLVDMRDALTMALAQGYALAKTSPRQEIPNPIALRRKVKPWFDSACGASYAKHHVNPVCRAAVALLRAYKKRNKRLGLPEARKLAMCKFLIKRLKQELIGKKMPEQKKETGICSSCGEEKDIWRIDGEPICKDCATNRITPTFGTREYVHLSGPVIIYIDVESGKKEELKEILRKIRYLGTSDSLVFCRSISEQPPDEGACTKRLEPAQSKEATAPRDFLILFLADLKQGVAFREVNPYEDVRNREPFSLYPYVFPLRLESKGTNWKIYSKTK